MLSIKHAFLFIHRGKTGGNSISEVLLPYSDDVKAVDGSYRDGVDRFDVENPTYKTKNILLCVSITMFCLMKYLISSSNFPLCGTPSTA